MEPQNFDSRHSEELLKLLEKQSEVLMESQKSMLHKLQKLQVEERMLMHKFYEIMSAHGLTKKIAPALSKGKEELGQTKGSIASPMKKGPNFTNDLDEFAGKVDAFDMLKKYVKTGNPIQVVNISMPKDHWGKAFSDHIGMENIQEIISHKWLSASSICVYIRFLCETYLNDPKKASKFSFISPFELEDTSTCQQHIVELLIRHAGKDHLVLAPYNVGRHWVLIAINTSTEKVYYMDPLQQKLEMRPHMHNLFTNAILAYRVEKGVVCRTKMTQTSWVTVQCPKQSNGVDCGYYVCIFIRDILHQGHTMIPLNYLEEFPFSTFPNLRVQEFRREWCAYLYQRFLEGNLNGATY